MTSKRLSDAEKESLTRADVKSFRERLGSVAEWSKALVLGTSHFGGVGSNPTTIKSFEPTVPTSNSTTSEGKSFSLYPRFSFVMERTKHLDSLLR